MVAPVAKTCSTCHKSYVNVHTSCPYCSGNSGKSAAADVEQVSGCWSPVPTLLNQSPECDHIALDEILSCPHCNLYTTTADNIGKQLGELSGHPAFYSHLDRLRDLHSQKAQAYEGKSGYYANYRRFDKWSEVIAKHPKLAGFCYSMLRLEEKFERIRNILEGSLAGDEPVVENLDDMAVISVIARILYEEANETRT